MESSKDSTEKARRLLKKFLIVFFQRVSDASRASLRSHFTTSRARRGIARTRADPYQARVPFEKCRLHGCVLRL